MTHLSFKRNLATFTYFSMGRIKGSFLLYRSDRLCPIIQGTAYGANKKNMANNTAFI